MGDGIVRHIHGSRVRAASHCSVALVVAVFIVLTLVHGLPSGFCSYNDVFALGVSLWPSSYKFVNGTLYAERITPDSVYATISVLA